MPSLARISDALQAVFQLGFQPVRLYASYRMRLRSGILRLQTRSPGNWSSLPPEFLRPVPVLALPERNDLINILGEAGVARLREEADEIAAGKARLFGGGPVDIKLSASASLRHWTEYELGRADPFQGQSVPIHDIKFIWEPARFAWAFTLGKAYRVTQEERYPEAFWRFFEEFQAANPAYLGPQWMSAQEVALRLIALVFASQAFSASPHSTPARITRLGVAIAEHAGRIPPTIDYARSQNNNHLLSEAAGLFTAGLALPNLQEAPHWRELGWKLLHSGLQNQISHEGVYIQHSSNYQRLMLQIALWVQALVDDAVQNETRQGSARLDFPTESRARLAAAARWLLALVDEETGRTPNLGPNDGAYLFPLSECPFHDYRPTLQAAAEAWPGGPVFAPGVLRSPDGASWAYLRAAKFTSRPGHADQLHLDLWWRGLNVAQDAGTYLYNAAPPWDNALARSDVHNTITIDGLDQMKPAGKFLWLDWAQAEWVTKGSRETLIARHDGYRRIGVIHQRAVSVHEGDRWRIEDQLFLPAGLNSRKANLASEKPHIVRLQWLLPDWPWELLEDSTASFQVKIRSPHGWVKLRIDCPSAPNLSAGENQIVRTGERLLGASPISPRWGWVSPTYGTKVPALSIVKIVTGTSPLTLTSEWEFPHKE